MSKTNDKSAEKCLSRIMKDVAVATGAREEEVCRLFELAKMVHEVDRARKAGTLASAPRTMQ